MTATQTQPRVLSADDAAAMRSLVDRSLALNCVVDSRLQLAPDLNAQRLGGFVWGMDDTGPEHGLRAAAFHGGNLIPVGDDLDALQVIAEQLGRTGRGCSSIVGSVDAVEVMWPVLARHWGQARTIRRSQPLLRIDERSAIAPDPAVRRVTAEDLPMFLPAAIAMFTEELDISPIGSDGGRGYRNRVSQLINAGRAFARFDDRGRVEFKAEIGALGSQTAQIQGVWVRPDLRGRGLGTAAMSAVLDFALQKAPTVSLYVNDFNTAGRRMYDRLGMYQIGTLSTVLF